MRLTSNFVPFTFKLYLCPLSINFIKLAVISGSPWKKHTITLCESTNIVIMLDIQEKLCAGYAQISSGLEWFTDDKPAINL